MDFLSVSKKIERFISDKVDEAGAKGVVIGLSGGLDSALVATLAVRALGEDKVMALILPSPTNSPHDVEDAKQLAVFLGIHKKILPLKDILEAYEPYLDKDKVALGNLTARVRMSLLYYHANKFNYLVAGTGNKSELSIGYSTKHGDGGCDMLPIGGLYKTEVQELSRFLKLPKRIIEKAPSAGLWQGQTDEKELGLSYQELDAILKGKKSSIRIQRMVNSSEHKRKTPEICKL